MKVYKVVSTDGDLLMSAIAEGKLCKVYVPNKKTYASKILLNRYNFGLMAFNNLECAKQFYDGQSIHNVGNVQLWEADASVLDVNVTRVALPYCCRKWSIQEVQELMDDDCTRAVPDSTVMCRWVRLTNQIPME